MRIEILRGGKLVPQEDQRRSGSVHFADPAAQGFSSQVHTFNEPHSCDSGTPGGVRSNFGMQAPWANSYGGDQQYRDMLRKRGVSDEQEGE